MQVKICPDMAKMEWFFTPKHITRTISYFFQYRETNMIYPLFSLLRIKGLYVFRPLLAQPQDALHKRHLVYCVRVMSIGCAKIEVPLQSWYSQLT
jgi:hypothetical protein